MVAGAMAFSSMACGSGSSGAGSASSGTAAQAASTAAETTAQAESTTAEAKAETAAETKAETAEETTSAAEETAEASVEETYTLETDAEQASGAGTETAENAEKDSGSGYLAMTSDKQIEEVAAFLECKPENIVPLNTGVFNGEEPVAIFEYTDSEGNAADFVLLLFDDGSLYGYTPEQKLIDAKAAITGKTQILQKKLTDPGVKRTTTRIQF